MWGAEAPGANAGSCCRPQESPSGASPPWGTRWARLLGASTGPPPASTGRGCNPVVQGTGLVRCGASVGGHRAGRRGGAARVMGAGRGSHGAVINYLLCLTRSNEMIIGVGGPGRLSGPPYPFAPCPDARPPGSARSVQNVRDAEEARTRGAPTPQGVTMQQSGRPSAAFDEAREAYEAHRRSCRQCRVDGLPCPRPSICVARTTTRSAKPVRVRPAGRRPPRPETSGSGVLTAFPRTCPE